MRKIVTLGAVLVLVLMGLVLAVSVPADASEVPYGNDANQSEFWEQDGWTCTKDDNEKESGGYTMPEPPEGSEWTLLVIKKKSGPGSNVVTQNPVAGQTYIWTRGDDSGNGKGYSHVITCSKAKDVPPHDECDNLPGDQPEEFDCDGPEPEKREKVSEKCGKGFRFIDYYETPYVLVDGKWVLGEERWVGKDTEPLTAAECDYEPQVRKKVTVKCGAGGQWVDYYVREWSFVNKQWVLGKEKWSHKEFVKFDDETYFEKCAPEKPQPEVVDLPTPPVATEPKCDVPGSLTVPFTPGVVTTVSFDGQPGLVIEKDTAFGAGDHLINYVPANGYDFPEGTEIAENGYPVSVGPSTGDCPSGPEESETPVDNPEPTEPERTDPVVIVHDNLSGDEPKAEKSQVKIQAAPQAVKPTGAALPNTGASDMLVPTLIGMVLLGLGLVAMRRFSR